VEFAHLWPKPLRFNPLKNPERGQVDFGTCNTRFGARAGLTAEFPFI
jgi:hypothetical protein